jgi:hypothetical protein
LALQSFSVFLFGLDRFKMEINILDRSERNLGKFELPSAATLGDLKAAFAKKCTVSTPLYPSLRFFALSLSSFLLADSKYPVVQQYFTRRDGKCLCVFGSSPSYFAWFHSPGSFQTVLL